MEALIGGNAKEHKALYANYKAVQQRYGISIRFLKDLVTNNKVRSIKLSPSRSAQRLYHVPDIEIELNQLISENGGA